MTARACMCVLPCLYGCRVSGASLAVKRMVSLSRNFLLREFLPKQKPLELSPLALPHFKGRVGWWLVDIEMEMVEMEILMGSWFASGASAPARGVIPQATAKQFVNSDRGQRSSLQLARFSLALQTLLAAA
jgi:hypothetical protein